MMLMDANYQFFMEMDMQRYTGQWVAIHEKKVVSSGADFKEVFAEAKKVCRRPFIAKVPEKETMIF
jgi:hypothetical protein